MSGYYPNGTEINSDDCTLALCPVSMTQLGYIPTLAGNIVYLSIFAILLLAHIGLGIWYRIWGVLAGMFGGLLLEILGYVGRVQMHNDPFSFNAFLLYIICLTIGPAWISAAIYLCLGRIIVVYGTNLSRLKPRTYTIVFICCDLVSLVLQSIGGALTSEADTNSAIDTGVNIMIAGLAFQVFSLVLFMVLWAEFVWSVHRAQDGMKDPSFEALRRSFMFRAFQYSLWIGAITITIRSIYRVAELQSGFDSKLATNEAAFMVLEGPMIIVATFLLAVFHPGLAFAGNWASANWSLRKKRETKGSNFEEEFQLSDGQQS